MYDMKYIGKVYMYFDVHTTLYQQKLNVLRYKILEVEKKRRKDK